MADFSAVFWIGRTGIVCRFAALDPSHFCLACDFRTRLCPIGTMRYNILANTLGVLVKRLVAG